MASLFNPRADLGFSLGNPDTALISPDMTWSSQALECVFFEVGFFFAETRSRPVFGDLSHPFSQRSGPPSFRVPFLHLHPTFQNGFFLLLLFWL